MRIVSFYYTHKPGGFCQRLYRLLNALHTRGHEVHYLSLDPPPSLLRPEISFHRIPFPTQARSGALFWWLLLAWLPAFVAWRSLSLKPNRIVVFGAFYATVALPARYLTGTPILLFMRALVFKINRLVGKNSLDQWVSNSIDKIGIRNANQVVCMTKAMRTDLEVFAQYSLESAKLLPNDLPAVPSTFRRSPHTNLSRLRLLAPAGVLNQGKNIEFLLQALGTLSIEEQVSLPLKIAGSGGQIEQLKARVTELQLSHVTFAGWISDMNTEYAECDVMLHPSLTEGMSNAVLEALARDCVVLCGDTAESRELMVSDELLFSLNEPRELAQRLLAIQRNPNELDRLRTLCQEAAERVRFDWDGEASAIVLEVVS